MRSKKKAKPTIGLKVKGVDDILKRYPNSGLATDIVLDPDEVIWLPSRSLRINNILGGGIPYGRILEVFGGESSGKTILALDFAAVTQALGGIVLWDDAEQSFTRNWAELNGVDLSKVYLSSETAVEKISDWVADMGIYLRSQLTNNEPILFVVDSTAALECLANINVRQVDKKAEMGNRAKAIGDMLRLRNELWAKLGITSIFINQLRLKLNTGMFEDPETTPGGQALKFYAAIRMGMYRAKRIGEGKGENAIWLGNNVNVRIKKNKVAPPKPSFTTEIYFNPDAPQGIGISKYLGLSDIFIKEGLITRKGGNHYFNEDLLAKSGEEMDAILMQEDNILRQLTRHSSINTITKTKKVLKSLNRNLFPVTNIKITKQVEDSGNEEQ